MKVQIIKSCLSCSNSEGLTLCGLGLYCKILKKKVTDSIYEEDLAPDFINPDCPLNDLPTADEIKSKAISNTEDRYTEHFYEKGANYVLNKILK